MREPSEDVLSPAEIKKLKSELTAAKKRLKAEKAAFGRTAREGQHDLDDTRPGRSCSMRWSMTSLARPRTE